MDRFYNFPKLLKNFLSDSYCETTLKLQYFGHLMWRADSIWKDPDAGKDLGQEEKGTAEDEMVGWHHRLNGHEFG